MDLSKIAGIAGHVYDFVPAVDIDLPPDLSVKDARYLTDFLIPAYKRATAIYETLDLPIKDPKEAVGGWSAFADEMTRVFDSGFTNFLLANQNAAGPFMTAVVPVAFALNVSMHAYAGIISAAYWSATTGLFGHLAFQDAATRDYSIHAMVLDGTLDEKMALAHAAWAYTTFRMIEQLEKFHALAPLKKGASGLGFPPAAAIVIGVVIAIIIIAGFIVLSKNLSEVNAMRAKVIDTKLETLRETCAKATDPKVQLKCAEGPTADDLSAGTFATELSKAMASAGNQVIKYAMIGLGVFLGIQLLPTLIPKLFASGKAIKESAMAPNRRRR